VSKVHWYAPWWHPWIYDEPTEEEVDRAVWAMLNAVCEIEGTPLLTDGDPDQLAAVRTMARAALNSRNPPCP
jgi:hypothetical protein